MKLTPVVYVLVLFILCFFYSCNTGSRKSTNTEIKEIEITGKVVAPSGEPVGGVTVQSDPPSATGKTNDSGRFGISRGLKPGLYKFTATDQDGNTGSTKVVISYGETLDILIRLGETIDITTEEDSGIKIPTGKGGIGTQVIGR